MGIQIQDPAYLLTSKLNILNFAVHFIRAWISRKTHAGSIIRSTNEPET